MPNLTRLNALPEPDAVAAFRKCCGSIRWATRMALQRPYADDASLLAAADAVEKHLTRDDWLEAFSAHPKIGDVDSLRNKFAHTAAWSAQEQSGMNTAAEETICRLADGNRVYEERFGHIFIVCATGKTADEMLAILESRWNNAPEDELRIAAGEQIKITRLRLERLCQ